MTAQPTIRFSAIGLNHFHIYGQTQLLLDAGAELVAVYDPDQDLLDPYLKEYPQVQQAPSKAAILEDDSVQLVISAAIPCDRAPLGIEVMQHGKDYMSDKPGFTTLQQLAAVRKVQAETGRIYSIDYSERFENRATTHALALVQSGAIGRVLHTAGLGPHRPRLQQRPPWFLVREKYGGIICDIGSHQFDQFLMFSGQTNAEIAASQVANYNHPQHPGFEDFGEIMLRADGCSGYIRLDWFTPDGLDTWGDARLTVVGTEGYIEVRKNIDIAGRPGPDHLFLVDKQETRYIDSSQVELPYGRQLLHDVVNRTETVMPQDYCFVVSELALTAQAQAERLGNLLP